MNSTPKHCPQCGGTLDRLECDGRFRPVCSACGHIVYLNPLPSVAAILFQEGRVLLVRRNIEPGFGRWCLPGGFIETGETSQEAVIREIREETGLQCQPLKIVDIQTSFNGFYGDVLVICFEVAFVSGSLQQGADADQVGFFESDNMPPLAFKIHEYFIDKHWNRRIEFQES